MTTRQSMARWEGSLKEGGGSLKLGSGHFEGPYTWASRFADGSETNPEELIGAAHASCYSMFLSAILTREKHPPEHIETVATVHLGDGPTITRIELDVQAAVDGVDDETFQGYAREAKEKCPVSKALAAVPEIVLDARLI
jgi:osmotically inducible protein OsmC